jgi:hypothetical protein
MSTTGKIVARYSVLHTGSFTLGTVKELTAELPDDYNESTAQRRSVLAFIARPDHGAEKSELIIQLNRLPGHTVGIRPDHRVNWLKGMGWDHGLWWAVPAGKLKKGRKNTIEFLRTGGSGFGNIRVRAVVLWYNRMLRVPA